MSCLSTRRRCDLSVDAESTGEGAPSCFKTASRNSKNSNASVAVGITYRISYRIAYRYSWSCHARHERDRNRGSTRVEMMQTLPRRQPRPRKSSPPALFYLHVYHFHVYRSLWCRRDLPLLPYINVSRASRCLGPSSFCLHHEP